MPENNEKRPNSGPVKDIKDQKSYHFVVAFGWILVICFLAVAAMLFYLSYQGTQIIKIQKGIQNLSLPDKIKSQVGEQSIGESVTITINESDINSLLTSYPNFPLKNPSATIAENGITIKGKTGLMNMEVLVIPKIENKKIKYDISEIKAAGVPAPKSVSDAISGELSKFISSKMPNTKQVNFETVHLQKGIVQASGKRV